MDFVNFGLIFLVCIGFFITIFALLKRDKSADEIKDEDYLEVGATVQIIKKAVEEADEAAEQLDLLTKNIFEEFEEKYQELLFLYQMIEEMKEHTSKEVKNLEKSSEEMFSKTESKKRIFDKNPKYEAIKKMHLEGLSVSEISKSLGIGQGEVKLMLELGKDR